MSCRPAVAVQLRSGLVIDPVAPPGVAVRRRGTGRHSASPQIIRRFCSLIKAACGGEGEALLLGLCLGTAGKLPQGTPMTAGLGAATRGGAGGDKDPAVIRVMIFSVRSSCLWEHVWNRCGNGWSSLRGREGKVSGITKARVGALPVPAQLLGVPGAAGGSHTGLGGSDHVKERGGGGGL